MKTFLIFIKNLNTSYVKVLHHFVDANKMVLNYLNTSYVKVLNNKNNDLNTSYVKVLPYTGLTGLFYIDKFKYIICKGSTIGALILDSVGVLFKYIICKGST